MKKKGFTLIEILAVIVILGIVAIIAIPAVSSYISDSRNKTYKAHESSMIEAAKSFTVECIDGKENCTLPSGNGSSEIFLSELIDKGFTEKLQNPQGEGYCNEELSYVRVTTKGKGYEYHSCLYCGNYVTEDDGCADVNAADKGSAPVCGTVTGQSSEWTNKPRTIIVACTDPDNDCRFNTFPKTYKTTTITDLITISDLKGNTKKCSVNVNVDTTAPTCDLIRAGGHEEQQTGWYSGNVIIGIQNQTDANSGLLTYGMGTSKTPDYNRKSSISLQDVSGLVTVFGYVKDNAGNEGVCTQTIRVGVEQPDFDIYYGYQLLPTKEKYSLTGASISTDETNITMNGANAKLTFNNMNKYENVKRAVIFLNNTVGNGTTYSLKYGSKTVSGQVKEGTNRLVFEMDKGTYGTYEFTLGDSAGTLNIKRIELEKERGDTYNTYSSKNITVNLVPSYSTEKVKTTEFSFDNGSHYQPQYYKEYSSTSSGYGKTKSIIGMVSNSKSYNVANFDKNAPSVNDITANSTEFTSSTITLSTKAQDTESGLVQYAWSNDGNLTYSSTEWKDVSNAPKKTQETFTHTVDRNQTVYFYAKDEAGNVTKKSYIVAVIDDTPPTCTTKASKTGWTNQNVIVTGECSDSGSSGCLGNSQVVVDYEVNGQINPGRVCDKAGNCVDCGSILVQIDKTPPTCTANKSNLNTTAGVSASFSCDNNSGGSTTNCKENVTGLKSNQSYSISDSAGNTGTCSVTVSSKQQKQTKSCTKGNTCENSAFGTHNCNCAKCNGTTCLSWTNGTCKRWNKKCVQYEQVCTSTEEQCAVMCLCDIYYHDGGASSRVRPSSEFSATYCSRPTSASCITTCNIGGAVYGHGYPIGIASRRTVCTGYGNGSTCLREENTTCAEYNQDSCASWNQVDCNCQQCPNSQESAQYCGCKTWGDYGSWSDDASCTYSGESEATNHSTKSQCRTVYY